MLQHDSETPRRRRRRQHLHGATAPLVATAAPATTGAAPATTRAAPLAAGSTPTAPPHQGRARPDRARFAAAQRDVARLLRAAEWAALSRRLEAFAELVEASGPLAYLRFDATRFTRALAPHLAPALQAVAAAAPGSAVAGCDALYRSVISELADTTFLTWLRGELARFAALPFVPDADLLAASAAWALTPAAIDADGLRACEVPALRAVFRAQLLSWLEQQRANG